MTYFAVIDTNVIVSSMLKANSIPGTIIQLIRDDVIIPLVNEEIINEYIDVLTRNKFDFDPKAVDDSIRLISTKGIFINREQRLEDFIDKDDIVFYEIVMSARNTMDAYLVTGNMRHYPIRNYIVTPREMIEIIEKDNGIKTQIDSK